MTLKYLQKQFAKISIRRNQEVARKQESHVMVEKWLLFSGEKLFHYFKIVYAINKSQLDVPFFVLHIF